MGEPKGVLVCGEIVDGRVAAITGELLAWGRKLAGQLGENLSAALLGDDVSAFAAEAIALGADKVYLAESPQLQEADGSRFADALRRVVDEANPAVVLLGQTGLGRDLAPRLAFRLGTGLSMDCVELDIDPATKRLVQTRPAYGGNVRAVFVSDGPRQIATVRTKTISAPDRDSGRKGEVKRVDPDLDPGRAKVQLLRRVKEEVAGVKLEDAATVVTGGRGIGGTDGMKELAALAKLLKGAVGATRPVVDSGWAPSTVQIGLTGKVVAPDLYIAVALSGSSQHMAGCSGAKRIVAINRDAEADVFKEAHFGIVADWKQAIPALTEKIRELLER